MASPKLAVFDLDGTLVDSRRSIADAMARAFESLDLPAPTYDDTRKIVGLSVGPAIRALAPDLDDGRHPELVAAFTRAFSAGRTAGAGEPLYEGARDLLFRLKDDGWLLGIATGNSRRGVDHFLSSHDVGALFDCAFCADDGPGKPDPHMLRLNMSAAGAHCDATIMIGDTSFDMQMARAVNAYAQGVAWGFHTPDEILAGGAHHIAEDFAGLAARFAEINFGRSE